MFDDQVPALIKPEISSKKSILTTTPASVFSLTIGSVLLPPQDVVLICRGVASAKTEAEVDTETIKLVSLSRQEHDLFQPFSSHLGKAKRHVSPMPKAEMH